MSSQETKQKSNLGEKPATTDATEEERHRLRDIIVVIVTYPLTPTERTGKLARSKPWLEFASLLLKLALAAYALYEVTKGSV